MGLADVLLQRLPSVISHDVNSNVGKLMQIFTKEIEEIKTTVEEINKIRDVDYAYNVYLDRAGINVGQRRGQLGDKKYRILIKGRIARNLSSGSINKIIEVLATMMNVSVSEIDIEENPGGEPASLYIAVPLKPIGEIGLSYDHFVSIVNRIAAGGVRPYTRLRGTFEFGEIVDGSSTFAVDSGFGDVNNVDTGGYLGSWHDLKSSDELPEW